MRGGVEIEEKGGEKKAGKEKKRNIERMIREWGQGKDETWEKV